MKLIAVLGIGAALSVSFGWSSFAIAQGAPAGAAAQAVQPAPAVAPTAAPTAEGARSAMGDRRMAMTKTEPVTASDYKTIDAGPLLLAAYGVVWLVFFALLLYTFVRMRRVGDDLRRLEAQLQATKVD